MPEEAFELLEEIRPSLAPLVRNIKIPEGVIGGGKIDSDMGVQIGVMLMQAVADVVFCIPPAVVRKSRDRMFRLINYTSPNVQSPTVLVNDVNTVFNSDNKLTAAHIYHVLGWAFWSNFQESFGVLQSLIPEEELASDQPAQGT